MFKNPKNVVIAYISIVCIYTLLFILQNKSNISLLDSSGLGDFLSGLFAPIAFLYLFLGHKQQEKALNKTNHDLLEQLEIQKQMLKIQMADLKAKEHAALPIIQHRFYAVDLPHDSNVINPVTSRPYESYTRKITIKLLNSGEKVSQVNVRCIEPFVRNIAFNRLLDSSKELAVDLRIKASQLEEYRDSEFIDLRIRVEYFTSLGIQYFQLYNIGISSQDDTQEIIIFYDAKSTPTRIDNHL